MVKPVLQAAAIAAVCAALLAATNTLTTARIARNQSAHERAQLEELVGGSLPATAPEWQNDVWTLCDGRRIVRTSAVGYGGPMQLLVGWREGKVPVVTGVRVASHGETPGIADFLDKPAQGWLAAMTGNRPTELAQLDTVTGATITSRAVQAAVAASAPDQTAPNSGCPP